MDRDGYMAPPRRTLRAALVRTLRWGLPWIVVTAMSTSLAYGMTQVMSRATTEATCQTTTVRLMYIGLNTWIPAEPAVTTCTDLAGGRRR